VTTPPSSPAGPASRPVAGIVLAGGRATRFGRDKLAEPLHDRPLLHHALLSVAPAVDELVLVIRPHGAPPRLPAAELLGRPVRLVRDPEPYGGPLIALAAALATVAWPVALFVAGDMPALRPDVLSAMVRALEEHGADVVLLAGPGPVQTIPAALRVAAAGPAAEAALAAGSRALRALYDRLRVVVLPEAEWRRLDPEAATLRDVDTPADLERER
jgi:molybdopterin-guanine dinucleotide biosynthesis protein A